MTNVNNDELKKERNSMMEFARIGELIKNELESSRDGKHFLKNYSRDEIHEILEHPKRNQDKIRNISRTLYVKSSHYKRLIDYFAGLSLVRFVLEPTKDISGVGKKTVLNQFNKTAQNLENMNLPHELVKIYKLVFREDVFFGYEHETKESYYIQPLNPDLCKLSYIEDGVYNLDFDMSYFERNEDALDSYASEFREKYEAYKKRKIKNKREDCWVEIDSDKTIVMKLNEDLEFSIPPFIAVFDSIFDIQGFKRIRKIGEELSNYMILAQELPIREDSDDNNDFLIDFDTMKLFHNMASNVLPDQVGLVTSPMKITPISLINKNKSDSDVVARAERDFWGDTGTSQLLFNTDKASSIGLASSIKTDEMIIFRFNRQIERWVNRRIKKKIPNSYFKFRMLDMTVFNEDEVFKRLVEAGSYGIPVKTAIGASLGLTPATMMNMAYFENEVLEMGINLVPLQSSHTQGSDEDSAEANTKDTKDLTPEGARTRDKDMD